MDNPRHGTATGRVLLGSSLALLGTVVVGVGAAHCLGSDPAIGAGIASFVGNVAANFGTDYLRRLHGGWLDRTRPAEENYVIIRTLRSAQIEALREISDRFDRHRRTDHVPARRIQADRFSAALGPWLNREGQQANAITLDDVTENASDVEHVRRQVIANLPADFDAALGARHGLAQVRQRLGAVAEAALLGELCAALPWDPRGLPPLFSSAFRGSRDGTDGWFARFVAKAAQRLRVGGEFERIWNAEQLVVIRFLMADTSQQVANLEVIVEEAKQALCRLGTTLDAIAGDSAAARQHGEITQSLLRSDLDLPLNLKSNLSAEGWRRFSVNNVKIPFYGRQEELAALRRFLDDPRDVLWWIVTGAGGSGKTRLALELCLRAHADGWRGGFLYRFREQENVAPIRCLASRRSHPDHRRLRIRTNGSHLPSR